MSFECLNHGNRTHRTSVAAGNLERQSDEFDAAALSAAPRLPTMFIDPETHPLYIGLYEGAMGRAEVTQFVEESDCVALLGTFMTDLNLGIYTANLDPAKCIDATSEQLRIHHHRYHGVLLSDFIRELTSRKPSPPRRVIPRRRNAGRSTSPCRPLRRSPLSG